ncbi:hydroxyacylglutathione hydrolase [Rubidibacter lacunae KORDI 51-2]|uniref:Hydroxyacylglutathione hydrolase n=1 Tax=Rubidibacter lacunae KORDI 51-2 TaxID=582515 RepID=U5DH70_9CHRO|nr:hydroxyacylglutathione hydrolase [Rubidibacter lacunae]ERN40946.1 hydroxyacylglutathione hydrolase [Rubidibacter lacunae KORDI 51-2]
MQIERLPVRTDNYIFVLCDAASGSAAVVDPAEAQSVLRCLQARELKLVAIFITHHHHDHIGGNLELLASFPHATVYAGAEDRDRVPGQSVFLHGGDRVEFAGRAGEVLFVPGHTRAHIAYYFPPSTPSEPGELFVGDTIFAGGCGRLSEGTPAQMLASLQQLRSLPDATRVWCAHEYTLKNLCFALTVDGENPILQQRFADVQRARTRGEATVPSVLGIERRTNPFLRWDEPALQAAMQTKDPIRVFARLRGRRDLF